MITDHSTIGILVTTDGTITDIDRENYKEAEERVVYELKELNKPFVIVLNSLYPYSPQALELAEELRSRYNISVVPLDAANMAQEDVINVLRESLYEFPVTEVNVNLPGWIEELEPHHWLRGGMEGDICQVIGEIRRIRDLEDAVDALRELEQATDVRLSNMDLSTGISDIDIAISGDLFYRVLGEFAGEPIEGEQTIMHLIKTYAAANREWNKVEEAMEEVREMGYGVVTPQLDELYLEEPELIKQGGRFGVKLKASAPSYHIIRANISTEITPLIGTEKQCEELVRYILEEFEDDPQRMWNTNIFGKSLHDLVQEGIQGKLCTMPETAQKKLQMAMQRIVNDGGGGLICIII